MFYILHHLSIQFPVILKKRGKLFLSHVSVIANGLNPEGKEQYGTGDESPHNGRCSMIPYEIGYSVAHRVLMVTTVPVCHVTLD